MNSKLIYIILILTLSSCSLQKRLYTKGFYASKNQSTKKLIETDTTTGISSNLKLAERKEKNKNSTLLTVNSPVKSTKFLSLPAKLTGGCDTIVLKSGAKIAANISEISSTQIKFKNCGSANETDIFISKNDVNYMILANGSKEVFDTQKKYTQPTNPQVNNNIQPKSTFNGINNKNTGDKKHNGFALTGFIMALISHPVAIITALIGLFAESISGSAYPFKILLIPFIIAFAAFAFCVTAIYQVSKDKENQKGLTIAIIGAFLSLLLMIVLFLFYFGILV